MSPKSFNLSTFGKTYRMIYFNGIKGKNYFEGWFFRICAEGFNCALIPSVSVCDGERKAYIQINCNRSSKKLEFDFEDFCATNREVWIGDNHFSDEGITFSSDFLSLDVKFGAFEGVEKDIMGCFKFGTPCKHKLISMKHAVKGTARFGNKKIMLKNAVGYIEKDWGKSFPKAYCWLQCNQFEEGEAAFFLSVADIRLPVLGLICVLLAEGKEYRFATYNFSRIEKLQKGEIVLRKSDMRLQINFSGENAQALSAPEKGKMKNMIKEDLDGTIDLKLCENEKVLYTFHGKNAGMEWVNLK